MPTDQAEFEAFCRDLEDLRNRSKPIRLRAGFTDRILAAVRREKPAVRPASFLTPASAAAAAFLVWLWRRPPLARVP